MENDKIPQSCPVCLSLIWIGREELQTVNILKEQGHIVSRICCSEECAEEWKRRNKN